MYTRRRRKTENKGNSSYMSEKVEVTGLDTSSLTTLSDRRADELMAALRKGDRAARQEFIKSNLLLVLSCVSKIRKRGQSADDLFQAGCVGLIKATDNFDPGMNVRFSTYAVPMIEGELRRHMRQSCVLKVGRRTKELAYKALSLRDASLKQTGEEPSPRELSLALGCTEAELREALCAISDPLSLYEPVYSRDGDELYLSDKLEAPDGDAWFEGIALREALRHCTGREKKLLGIRYRLGKTQTEAASRLGVSQAQISRLERGAIEKLRKYMT